MTAAKMTADRIVAAALGMSGHEVPARCKLCGLERTFYPERGLDMFKEQRSSQAKMANRKGQPKRHPKKVVAA